MRRLLAAAAFLFPAIAWPSPSWRSELPPALEAAKEKRSLVLVDFYAPWCYSCYYMDRNVLNQPELGTLSRRLEFVKVDVDSPEGAKLKSAWMVSFLPSYVILDDRSREVGRIVGEQARAEFFAQLRGILDKNAALEDLEAAAMRGALEAARSALEAHNKRRTLKEGRAFLKKLPAAVRKALEKDKKGLVEVLRLKLGLARAAKDKAACLEAGRELLQQELGCDYPYDASHVNDCAPGLEKQELAALAALIDTRILVTGERCADMRSAVSLQSELLEKAGRKPEADRLLERAVRLVRSELGGDLGHDRSKADNLRAFLAMAKRDEELDALYPGLIKAYPDDYVYRQRFARHLLGRGRPIDALRQAEAAEKLAYGANKLAVAEVKARAFAALDRKPEAAAELSRAAEQSQDTFPDQAASLRRLRDQLSR